MNHQRKPCFLDTSTTACLVLIESGASKLQVEDIDKFYKGIRVNDFLPQLEGDPEKGGDVKDSG